MISQSQLALSLCICRTLLIGAFMVGCAPVHALNPESPPAQYIRSSWRTDADLAAVRRLNQTPDGYLWLATRNGLKRFDGVRFSTYLAGSETGLESSTMQDLLVEPDGSLWIATLGGGITHYQRGGFHSYSSRDGLPSDDVESLYRDGHGVLWVGSRDGKIARFIDNRFEEVSVGIPHSPVMAFVEDADQSLWIGTWGNGVFHLKNGTLTSFSVKDGLPNNRVGGLYRDHSGRIWTAGWKGVSTWNGTRFVGSPTINALVSVAGKCMEDRDGNLWITSSSGLIRAHAGQVSKLDHTSGLSDDFVSDVFEDREGNLWVATRGGLDRLRDSQIRTFTPREGLIQDAGPILADRIGGVWTVSDKKIARIAANKITVWPVGLPSGSKPTTILSQLDSRFLVGFDRGGISWSPNGTTSAPEMAGLNVRCMLEARDGGIWIATEERGLLRFAPGSRSLLDTGVPDRFIVTLAEDQTGSIWAGSFYGGGLYRIAGNQVQHFGVKEGLPSPSLYTLFVDGRNRLWIGSAKGLTWFENGRVETVSTRQGLQSDLVWAIVDDAYDRLWFAGYGGLEAIDKKSLAEWAAGRLERLTPSVYRRTDGLQVTTIDRPFPNAVRSADGHLWFCITDGVLEVTPPDPATSQGSKFRALVEDATVDRIPHFEPDRISIPPGARSIEIRYTALTLSSPETVRFRYRLEGFDNDWVDADVRRVAYYNNLKPGVYTFRVEASASAEQWLESSPLLLEQTPFFYQTIWFRALCASGLLALLWSIYQIRIRQMQRRFNIALDARVNERTRIARELHDTLLQAFHGAVFQFQAARNLMTRRPEEALQSLDDAISETKKALGESREAIQDLRSEPVTRGHLAEFLMSMSPELSISGSNEHPPIFDLIEEGDRRALSSTVSNEICRIALELIRNAYQHALAQRIEAEIRYGDSMFRLRIRDNGKGIEPQVLKEGGKLGHWGLRGVRERADRIGARLDLWSEPGGGTEVQLLVPASIAYENVRDSYRIKVFRRMKRRA